MRILGKLLLPTKRCYHQISVPLFTAMGNKESQLPPLKNASSQFESSTNGVSSMVVTPEQLKQADEDILSKISLVDLDMNENYDSIRTTLDKKDASTVKCIAISDTHGLHEHISPKYFPKCDILIHAGDFTNVGNYVDVVSYKKWINQLMDAGRCKYAILVAGNHDITFQKEYYDETGHLRFHPNMKENADKCKQEILETPNLFYLEDSGITLMGIKFYGSPWQPEFCDWAFNMKRGKDLAKVWKKIPDDVDVLITHGPPFGHGDQIVAEHVFHASNRGKEFVGCRELSKRVMAIDPPFHVFGHIHEGYGVTKQEKQKTMFINASTVTVRYKVSNKPIAWFMKGSRAEQ